MYGTCAIHGPCRDEGECQRQPNSQAGLRLPVPRLGDVGLFEVDEATVPSALQHIQPRVLLLHNIFRDQLDCLCGGTFNNPPINLSSTRQ